MQFRSVSNKNRYNKKRIKVSLNRDTLFNYSRNFFNVAFLIARYSVFDIPLLLKELIPDRYIILDSSSISSFSRISFIALGDRNFFKPVSLSFLTLSIVFPVSSAIALYVLFSP